MTIAPSARLTPDVLMRLPVPADAAPLARAYQRSRDHLRPWEPDRSESFFTPAGQTERLQGLLAEWTAGRAVPWVLVRPSEGDAAESDVVGAVTLSGITRGPMCSASLGYWIDAGQVGRGLASAAVRAVCALSDTALGLHRLQAGTLLDNVASQRVLTKCGFTAFGTAERYLHINGAWRDHRLFQKILNDRRP
ncbi:GNAT family N-acetyltransferase [Streptomyces lydicus]|uniref:Alanine acetyltransferase n=1 Tax=Streptomyces lydicus TaxID=47763 RepID=A0A1D7VNY3_9ACTN|nr:GNAT family protein [Streptomyces lydicus]AOP48452.1 alanine acetyltransferase [Streptomyces lydicus]